MPQIIFCQNSQNYQIIDFNERITIGRDSDNEIVLNSRGVSRKHAIIIKVDNKYYLVDQGSKNAVWLGSETVQEVLLTHGLKFRITDYFFTFLDNLVEANTTTLCSKNVTEAPKNNNSHETMLMPNFSLRDRLDNTFLADKRFVPKNFESRIASSLAIGKKLTTPDEDELLETLLEMVVECTKAKCGFVAVEDKQGDLIYRAQKNFSPKEDNRKVNHELVANVIRCGESQIAGNETKIDSPLSLHNLSLCTPLQAGQETIGCCYLMFSSRSATDIETEKLLAEYVMLLGSFYFATNSVTQRSDLTKNPNAQTPVSSKNAVIESANMIRLYQDIKIISPINVPVLVLGEPGTGKELVANEIHDSSQRKGQYVTLNCSAIPEGIFESELFGSVKGAFHNAEDRPGKLELAHKGTLFLDEIGDMALSLQPKLLRFLENQELTRLGDTRVKKLDVRIIAATNQDLQAMIEKKSFRADLYQRLSCFSLNIPPLRERKDDILPLIHHFLKRFGKEYGFKIPGISDKALELLCGHKWLGNVRELRNSILRLAVHSQDSLITTDDIENLIEGCQSEQKQKVESFASLDEVESKHIKAALQYTNGNISDASKMLGIARSTLYKKLDKYSIENTE